MKKYLLMVLLTSVVMAALLAGSYFLLSGSQKKNAAARREEAMEELGIPQEKKEQDTSEAVPLVTEGENANVFVYAHREPEAVYNAAASKAVKDELDRNKRKNDYTMDHALWAIDPFGTNPLSLYLYFETRTAGYLKYSIYVEDKTTPDFTRTLYNGQNKNLTREHEYQLIGLVAGKDNYITLELCNEKDEVISRQMFKLSVDALPSGTPLTVKPEAGKSEELLSEGLFAVLGYDVKNEKIPPAIYMYDNSGILRSALPMIDYRSDRIEWVDGSLVYSCSRSRFVRVSPLGQVLGVYDLGNYQLHHDFVHNGYRKLYILATDKKSDSIQDLVISLDLETGEVKTLLDFSELLKSTKKEAKKEKGKKKLDWIHLNSITMAEGGDVIVSSRELSSIIKVENVTSRRPSVQYILADQKLYEGEKTAKKLLEKVYPEGAEEETPAPEEESPQSILETPKPKPEPFVSQYGQHTVFYEPDASLEEGRYYLYLFNNNYGASPSRPSFRWNRLEGVGTEKKEAANSLYYRYLVDENAGTYSLVETIKVPYSSIMSSAQNKEGHRIINSGTAGIFGEYDRAGRLIYQYRTQVESYHYRVFKYDFKQFLFE